MPEAHDQQHRRVGRVAEGLVSRSRRRRRVRTARIIERSLSRAVAGRRTDDRRAGRPRAARRRGGDPAGAAGGRPSRHARRGADPRRRGTPDAARARDPADLLRPRRATASPTRDAGRTVAVGAADDARGDRATRSAIDRFAHLGHARGGGPHALACAALLGDRVAAVRDARLASRRPVDEDLDFIGRDGRGQRARVRAPRSRARTSCARCVEADARRRCSIALERTSADDLARGLQPRATSRCWPGPLGDLPGGRASRPGSSADVDGWIDDDLAFAARLGLRSGRRSRCPCRSGRGARTRWSRTPTAPGSPGDSRASTRGCHPTTGTSRCSERRVGEVHAWPLRSSEPDRAGDAGAAEAAVAVRAPSRGTAGGSPRRSRTRRAGRSRW